MPKRVLLIEDDVPNMELMFHLLTTYGYLPQRARNAEEGFKLASREAPGLIISDVLMSSDGYEIARRIRADPQLSSTPMIAITALAMPSDRAKALAAGFDGYITKPISPESFLRHVETFLRSEFRGAAAPGGISAERHAEASASRGRKVLVVDDSPENLKLSSFLLEGAGYQVVTATGMSDALRLAREALPDLIVSDIIMDGGSGYEFIRAVKGDSRLSSIPFIFNTASLAGESTRKKGLALGAVRVLFRPIGSEELLHEVEACLSVV